MRFVISVIFLFCAIYPSFGQFKVQGIVRDTDSKFVENALVELIDQADTTRQFSAFTNKSGQYAIQVDTGIRDVHSAAPEKIYLMQNYPNPFNPSTLISWETSQSAFIKIDIHNVLGQKVKTLYEGFQTAGTGQAVWDATDDVGSGVPAGVYIYTMTVDDARVSKKMLLMDGHHEQLNLTGLIPLANSKMQSMLPKKLSDMFTMRITADNIVPYEHRNLQITKDTPFNVTVIKPGEGPAPAYNYDADTTDYVIVKNWDFGEQGNIRNIDDLSDEFQYHDQFGTIANGTNYGAYTVAPDSRTALSNQPIEFVNTNKPVREFFDNSMKTYLVPLDGAQNVHPTTKKAGCGSFQAKWKLPKSGALLGLDMIWETRVRYVTPPYFWFAIWTAGNEWDNGAEMDVVESFGYDNGGGYTNYDGRYWHSSVVGGEYETYYHSSWSNAMKKYGITNYDATEYHVWTWVYRADDTFTSYNDGRVVQRGKVHWTRSGTENGRTIDMSFIFDAGWGHSQVSSVNKSLNASEFTGKYYEWDYSRIYLRKSNPN